MKSKVGYIEEEPEKNQQTEEQKRKAFIDLIAQIIIDISFKEYQEKIISSRIEINNSKSI